MKKISYQIRTETNLGNNEQHDVVSILRNVQLRCGEVELESNMEIARKEAWGEVAVEDCGPGAPQSTFEDQMSEALISLYEEGRQRDEVNAQQDEAIISLFEGGVTR